MCNTSFTVKTVGQRKNFYVKLESSSLLNGPESTAAQLAVRHMHASWSDVCVARCPEGHFQSHSW